MSDKPKFGRNKEDWTEFTESALIGYMTSVSLHDQPRLWMPKICELAAGMADKMLEEKYKEFE